MGDVDEFSYLTTLILAAALDQTKWQMVLDHLSESNGGVAAHIFGYDLESKLSLDMVHAGYKPGFIEDYVAYYDAFNPWIERFSQTDPGVVSSTRWMCPPEEMVRTEFYADWVQPQGDLTGGGGTLLFKEDSRLFVIGGNIRQADTDKLEQGWLSTVSQIAPHMQQAFEINRALAGLSLEKAAMVNVSNPSETIVLLVDANRRIRFANSLGEAAINSGHFLRYDFLNRLVFTDLVANSNLEEATRGLKRVEFHTPLTFNVNIAESAETYRCHLARIYPDQFDFSPLGLFIQPNEPCLLMTLSPVRRENTTAAILANRYGVTASEAEVVVRIADGFTTRQISEIREVSLHTVRNQLKSAMSKLGVRRQLDLARLMKRLNADS